MDKELLFASTFTKISGKIADFLLHLLLLVSEKEICNMLYLKTYLGGCKKHKNLLCIKNNGNFLCLQCCNCNALIKGDVFHHPQTGKTCCTRHQYTCDLKDVMYMLMFSCGLPYTGETMNKVKLQLNKHKSTIRTMKSDLLVIKHFL